jgi:hypothetical protein
MRSMISSLSDQFLSHELINANARTGQNFINKFDNVGFAPSVLFREFFRLLPRRGQDVINARVAAVKDLFDPAIGVPLISDTRVR